MIYLPGDNISALVLVSYSNTNDNYTREVHKGGFSKGGFSNLCIVVVISIIIIMITVLLLNPFY